MLLSQEYINIIKYINKIKYNSNKKKLCMVKIGAYNIYKIINSVVPTIKLSELS